MIASSINAEKGYVIISITGKPTLEDYVDAARSLGKQENFYPSTHRICDFGGGQLEASSEEVAAFTDEVRDLPLENSTRTALVAASAEERQLLNAFASSFDRGEFKVFETGREALAWVLFAEPAESRKSIDKIRVHRLLGDIRSKDILAVQNSWFNQEGFDRDAPILWDLRKARLRIDIEDLQRTAKRMQEYSRTHRPDGKAAVLIASEMHESVLKSGFQQGINLGRLRFYWSESDAIDFLLADEQ